MRVLHSSDWHLGISNGAVSRAPDHDLFLDWLLEQLQTQEVDALVVAGDVFDSFQPSADALSRYYGFLCRVGATGVRQVVIVGGNHDSAARLDAPAEVLAALDVHVVGGIGGSPASWSRCLIPLKNRQGQEAAVILAVPYVHEFRLGVRTTDLDLAAVRAAFTQRFTELYRTLADEAQARWPGLPLLATGHLTLGAARREDYPHEIHQVGQIDGLPESVLDPRLQYVALGHIHRSYPVGDRRAWYSGSPVACSLPEASHPRKVLLVEVDVSPDGPAAVQSLEVPSPRALRELTGDPDSLLNQVRDTRWTEPLPPLLFCRAVLDEPEPDLSVRLYEALASFPEDARPAVVELRDHLSGPQLSADEDAPLPPGLEDLSPADVFATLCKARGVSDPTRLQLAFAELASADQESFDQMLLSARGGAA